MIGISLCLLVLLRDWVDIKPLLRDRALVWVLGTAHVESHSVREDPNLLEAQLLVAHEAVLVFADDQVGCLKFLLLLLCIERLEFREIRCDFPILIFSHLLIEK